MGVVATALLGCGRETPEQQVRQTLAAMQQAVETRDSRELIRYVADDFVGPGAMDRLGLQRTARMAFLRHGRVGVSMGPVAVVVATDGQHARASFTAALSGGDGTLLPDTLKLYKVDSGWRRADGEWQLTSLDWSGAP